MKLLKKCCLFLLGFLLLASILYIGIGYINYQRALHETPLGEKIEQVREQPHYVTIEEIAPALIQATISIEDHRFYDHHGVDYWSLIRALYNNIKAGQIIGGGSTITQQLAKNLYFDYQPSYIRKISEIFMAYELEQKLTKEEIAVLYVNVINYGDNHIGIYQASRGYFQKDPKDLTLKEATLLAGLPQSPSNYQLSTHYQVALQRQKQVLQAMLRDGKINETEMAQTME